MENPTFLKYFGIISGITAVLLLALSQFPLFQPYLFFSFFSLIFFMLITLIMYFVGNRSAKSPNKGQFIGITMAFTFLKIILSFIVVIGYYHIGHPTSKLFLLPFFIVYLIFTVYETYLMMQLGKQR